MLFETHVTEVSGQSREHMARRYRDVGGGDMVVKRVLVVDDNLDSAESLSLLLQLMGHTVRTAHDGEQALAAADEFRPELVLMDIGMPRMDGYEAARQLRQAEWSTDTVLVALTGWGQDEDKRRSEEAGFNHHLIKPVDPAALERLLARP